MEPTKDDLSSSLVDRFRYYREKLLQTNPRNRCIYLGKEYQKHAFDITRLEAFDEKISEKILKNAFSHKGLTLIENQYDTEEEISIGNRLYELWRNLNQFENETGTQYGYLGYPFLEGHLDDGFFIRAPVVLFPIKLSYQKSTKGWYLDFPKDSVPILNHTLLVALRNHSQIHFGEKLENEFDKFIEEIKPTLKDLEYNFLKYVEKLLLKIGCHIKDENFGAKTLPITEIKTLQLESEEKKPLKISNHKIIGNFPQGDSSIYEDYNTLISQIGNPELNHEVVSRLLSTESPSLFHVENPQKSDEVSPFIIHNNEKLNLSLNSDSSQDEIVVSSQNSPCTVISGPPGTGKSQVIVNIITNAISRGQKILVVCQKRVALEVIHKRLATVGLGKYSILLEKEKDDRKKIAEQLNEVINTSTKWNNFTDVDHVSAKINRIVKEQEQIAASLSKKYNGVSVRQLYLLADKNYATKLNLQYIINNIHYEDLEIFLTGISEIEKEFKTFELANHPWYHRKNFSVLELNSRNEIADILLLINEKYRNGTTLANIDEQSQIISLLQEHFSLVDTENLLQAELSQIQSFIENALPNIKPSVISNDYESVHKRALMGKTLWGRFKAFDAIQKVIDGPQILYSISTQTEILDTVVLYYKNNTFLKKLFSSKVRQAGKVVKKILKDPKFKNKNLQYVIKKFENGLLLLNIFLRQDEVKNVLENAIIMPTLEKQDKLLEDIRNYESRIQSLRECTSKVNANMREITYIFETNGITLKENDLRSQLNLFENGRIVFELIDQMSTYMNKSWIEIIQATVLDKAVFQEKISAMLESLKDFDKISAYDAKKMKLDNNQITVLSQCNERLDRETNWADSARQEILHCFIQVIEDENPPLHSYDFANHEIQQTTLRDLILEKQRTVCNKIIENVNNSIDVGTKHSRRTTKQARFKEFQEDLKRKRTAMSIRKLIAKYDDMIFDISPCWLASPEVVSNIFPLEKDVFDIIIMDEASQLAVERAIPLLIRGTRIVIAGDEKQLKPFDLFQTKESDNDEEDEDNISDVKSILELASKQYSSMSLKWHYRSKWQELVDFSNHAFYKGSLNVFPNSTYENYDIPIKRIKCNGTWEDGINSEEADKVVELISEYVQRYHETKDFPTLGVITFNKKQRDLIEKKIFDKRNMDEDFDKKCLRFFELPSDQRNNEIFIKNIENVQGDERDKIIFSIAYTKASNRFGSLSTRGGENRLNVAISRAINEITIVTSVEPEEMDFKNVKSTGAILLREFLKYAKMVNEGRKYDVMNLLFSIKDETTWRRDWKNDSEQIRKVAESIFYNHEKKPIIIQETELQKKIHQELKSRKYNVISSYGSSDFKIDLAVFPLDNHDKLVLGIQLDGTSFDRSSSVVDRDVMIPQFLREKRDWDIYHTWSKNWYQDPGKELEKIIARIEKTSTNP